MVVRDGTVCNTVGNQVKTQESAAVQGERANFWETEKERYRQDMTKKKNRMESESDDRRQNTKPKFTYFSEEGRKKVSKLVGCWCERVEVS